MSLLSSKLRLVHEKPRTNRTSGLGDTSIGSTYWNHGLIHTLVDTMLRVVSVLKEVNLQITQ